MVTAIKGVLVKCDEPTMQIILMLNEEKNFLIEKISETVCLCKENVHDFLEKEVIKQLEYSERHETED
ncbi:putative transcription factor TFIIH complex subunit Tfb5 [Plasmodium gaboni]|uniref:General transcription and DNA repair factor IIH subunit TFB5 n=1 Tax=Plasmodium gaboni TaxID=647221 RepID=A0A151LAN3_9APIC|nr:putative transcription factor TFIIH complex subunit Tfb5 [Plasmodium gaboni]XP_028540752.1 transcription factor TFIIH complex subunit Tfb5, putative [Plasmodium sp. gorilla clade G2]SOV25140.1 transcription factor TFIIH complex subunit Tfb5, putative [Plasmodium sp. DRC-Itaito]KYN96011.1 putative transcription factor TFIIH complex subunit Tfb5 [Plasmodium gaboni]SOV19251.1 transcription factor TFIIH complex subunit Tfb5, putative [Plasmodium gaboni]SOV19332.1 transcription factor TFIIH comp